MCCTSLSYIEDTPLNELFTSVRHLLLHVYRITTQVNLAFIQRCSIKSD